MLGSIQPQPIENAPDGTLPQDKIAAAIKPIESHFARTRRRAISCPLVTAGSLCCFLTGRWLRVRGCGGHVLNDR